MYTSVTEPEKKLIFAIDWYGSNYLAHCENNRSAGLWKTLI